MASILWIVYLGIFLVNEFYRNRTFGRLFYLFLFCYSFYFVSQIDKNIKTNNLIFLILVLLFYQYEFFSGLQEIIIFSFLVLISKFFDRILVSKNVVYLILIILFSNLFIWIKSDGIAYFLLSLALILLIKDFLQVKTFDF